MKDERKMLNLITNGKTWISHCMKKMFTSWCIRIIGESKDKKWKEKVVKIKRLA